MDTSENRPKDSTETDDAPDWSVIPAPEIKEEPAEYVEYDPDTECRTNSSDGDGYQGDEYMVVKQEDVCGDEEEDGMEENDERQQKGEKDAGIPESSGYDAETLPPESDLDLSMEVKQEPMESDESFDDDGTEFHEQIYLPLSGSGLLKEIKQATMKHIRADKKVNKTQPTRKQKPRTSKRKAVQDMRKSAQLQREENSSQMRKPPKSNKSKSNRMRKQQQQQQEDEEEEEDEDDDAAGMFSCPFVGCKKKCVRKSSLTLHIQMKHNKNQHSRDPAYSDRAFATKEAHRNVVEGRFICPYNDCKKNCIRKSSLTLHIQTKHEKSESMCDQCDTTEVFTSKGSFRKHLLTHGEILHRCEKKSCTKSFKTRLELRQHHKEHLLEGHCSCTVPGCGMNFRYPKQLHRHMTEAHAIPSMFGSVKMESNVTPPQSPYAMSVSDYTSERARIVAEVQREYAPKMPVPAKIPNKLPNLASPQPVALASSSNMAKFTDRQALLSQIQAEYQPKPLQVTVTQSQPDDSLEPKTEEVSPPKEEEQTVNPPKEMIMNPPQEMVTMNPPQETMTMKPPEEKDSTFVMTEVNNCVQTSSDYVVSRNRDRPYACQERFCLKTFKSYEALHRHKKVHLEKRPYVCVFEGCGNAFKYPKAMDSHIKHSHPEGYAFRCFKEGCDKIYSTFVQIKKHEEIHADIRSFVCTYENCTAAFTTEYYRKTHMWKCHKRKRVFQCAECGKDFKYRTGLRRHTRRIHEGIRDEEADVIKNFLCPDCGKMFATNSSLLKHIESHNEDRPFLCTLCGMSFKKQDSFNRHSQAHSESKPTSHICPVCGMATKTQMGLTFHMKTHGDEHSDDNGQDRLPCSEPGCGKTFKTNDSLQQHLVLHYPEAHACMECNKVFKCYKYLNSHMKSHRGERRHMCSMCSKAFKTNKDLYVHMESHSNVRKYACPKAGCGRSYKTASTLRIHLKYHKRNELLHRNFRQHKVWLARMHLSTT